VSSDVQINAIMKAKKTLIAVGGNFGNTNELIIVSCKETRNYRINDDDKMAIMTSVLYFPINNTQTWKFKIQCPGPFTLDYVVPQNIPPTGPRWYSGLTAPPNPSGNSS